MDLDELLVITIDESFSALQAICGLRNLYGYDLKQKKVGIFFNFTLCELEVCILYTVLQ